MATLNKRISYPPHSVYDEQYSYHIVKVLFATIPMVFEKI